MEAIEARVNTGPNHINQVPVIIVGPIMYPESARLTVKNVITATSKDISVSFVIPSNVRNSSHNNRYSCHDVHEIDQSQFDDSIQFEQDSITIQFKTQIRHANVMFDEISSTPPTQRVLTDVYVKPIGTNQSHWLKHHFKIDSGACGNLMPLSMFKSLYNCLPSSTTINNAVHLLHYNKQEIKQLGTCHVSVKFRSTVKCVHFYIVPDRLKPILHVGDALALGITSFYCPIYEDWQSNFDLTNSVDSIHSNASSTVTYRYRQRHSKFYTLGIYYMYIDKTGCY